jgi:hypothetical protein
VPRFGGHRLHVNLWPRAERPLDAPEVSVIVSSVRVEAL